MNVCAFIEKFLNFAVCFRALFKYQGFNILFNVLELDFQKINSL